MSRRTDLALAIVGAILGIFLIAFAVIELVQTFN